MRVLNGVAGGVMAAVALLSAAPARAAAPEVIAELGVGGGIRRPVILADSSKAYVPSSVSHRVFVVRLDPPSIAASIPAGLGPVACAVSPDGGSVWVASATSRSVSEIDTATDAVVATVGLGVAPASLAVQDGSGTPLIAALNSLGSIDSLVVIDGATFTVRVAVPLPSTDARNPVLCAPDGAEVFVPNAIAGQVSFVDAGAGVRTASVPVGALPLDAVLSPDGGSLWVANLGSADVVRLETLSRGVSGRAGIAPRPFRITASAAGDQLLVLSETGSVATILSAADLAVRAALSVPRLSAGSAASDGAFHPSGWGALVGSTTGRVTVIDTRPWRSGGAATGSTALAAAASNMAMSPDGRRALVCLPTVNRIVVLDTTFVGPTSLMGALTGVADTLRDAIDDLSEEEGSKVLDRILRDLRQALSHLEGGGGGTGDNGAIDKLAAGELADAVEQIRLAVAGIEKAAADGFADTADLAELLTGVVWQELGAWIEAARAVYGNAAVQPAVDLRNSGFDRLRDGDFDRALKDFKAATEALEALAA